MGIIFGGCADSEGEEVAKRLGRRASIPFSGVCDKRGENKFFEEGVEAA